MDHPVLLSSAGSDRATGYNMSSKIIRRDGRLFAGWLEAPAHTGSPARIVLGVCDAATGTLQRTIQLGEGIDNHCGPALALDENGRLHAVIGAHSGDFLYRWSDSPQEPETWSAPTALGPGDTYPSLAVDSEGTLHLAHRERGARWQLWYRRKRPDRPWDPPRALAVSPTPGYNHYMQSLSVGPRGTLHLTLQFHFAASGRAADAVGRAAAYIWSDDGGDTWYNEGQQCDTLPLTFDSVQAICRHPGGGVRIGNHIVDSQNRPWLFGSLPGAPGGMLWRRHEDRWEEKDMRPAFSGLDFQGGRATSLSRDAAGRLHLVVAVHPAGKTTPWFDPGLELFHLVLDAEGLPLSLGQVTTVDSSRAHWLPALEHWDWNRPYACCVGGPWLLYTRGLNAGGIWGDNRNPLRTEVYLTKP